MSLAQHNILGQLEPVLSPESLLQQHLEAWGGLIQLWDSDPTNSDFVLSIVDRGNTLWYKLALHGDNSCIINGVYYSELDHGLTAVATRHGITRVEPNRLQQTVNSPDKKRKKSSMRIWRRFSIGTVLKTDNNDKKSPENSSKQIRRANSLRLFHPKVTRKFSLKNAHHDTAFRPAEIPESHSHSQINLSIPVRNFVMPPEVEGPFSHATLPRVSRGKGSLPPSVSTGQLPKHTDLDSVLAHQITHSDKRVRHRNKVKETELLELENTFHRKLTRSNSVDREIQQQHSPTRRFGSCPKLSKYARSTGRVDNKSPDLLVHTSPQSGVNWTISLPTDQRPSRTQDLSCPGDKPQPILLDSRSAVRYSVFPIESATIKSGSVLSSRVGRMPGEEAEAPRQIQTSVSIHV
ncbi:hypothetical protein LOD99_14937 [Oopsacas minuta]|uniref:Uncharacterized protein n=1 Tax=Oopsacas minuta TaxID=111878 RepID=A0AAV7KDT1_9METZ|nr:hypothetical protein LOD99_14937 [Oopsacas minuta]